MKETVKKIMNEDTSAIADIKLSIMEKLNVEYKLKEIDEAKEKSKECSAVLQLMDKDYSYSEALKKVIKDYNVKDKDKLEKELDIYI